MSNQQNIKNYVNAIQSALNEQSTHNLFEISITLREMWQCGEKKNIFCLNGKSYINLGWCTLYSDQVKSELEKAVEELKKMRPEQCKNIHLVYEKTSSGRKVCRISLKDWHNDCLNDGEFVSIVDHHEFCKPEVAYNAVKQYPNYEIRLRAGFAWKGALTTKNETLENMKDLIRWAVVIDVDIDHVNKFILVNGFSANDMY